MKKPSAPRRIKAAQPPAQPDPAAPTPERRLRGWLAEDRTWEFEPAEPGQPARRVAAKPLRDLNANAARRLSRCPGLTPGQILAGGLFERDHEVARLEPRMTANLSGTGGSRGLTDELPLRVLEARDRKQAALSILRLGGPEVVRVVESVVLDGVTVTDTGQARYANRSAAKAWVSLALNVGLTLLESHYRLTKRMA